MAIQAGEARKSWLSKFQDMMMRSDGSLGLYHGTHATRKAWKKRWSLTNNKYRLLQVKVTLITARLFYIAVLDLEHGAD